MASLRLLLGRRQCLPSSPCLRIQRSFSSGKTEIGNPKSQSQPSQLQYLGMTREPLLAEFQSARNGGRISYETALDLEVDRRRPDLMIRNGRSYNEWKAMRDKAVAEVKAEVESGIFDIESDVVDHEDLTPRRFRVFMSNMPPEFSTNLDWFNSIIESLPPSTHPAEIMFTNSIRENDMKFYARLTGPQLCKLRQLPGVICVIGRTDAKVQFH